MLFPLLTLWAATGGSLLGNGLALGNQALIITGTAMSAICPGGVLAAWTYTRITRRRTTSGPGPRP